jgi:hypothetical protein
MKRRFQGLHQADQSVATDVPDGVFLVQVQRLQYRWYLWSFFEASRQDSYDGCAFYDVFGTGIQLRSFSRPQRRAVITSQHALRLRTQLW